MKTNSLILGFFILFKISCFSQELFIPDQNIGNSSNNNIGIGTNIPSSKLEIKDLHPIVTLIDEDGGVNAKSLIQFGQMENNQWSRTAFIGDGFNYSRDFGISIEHGKFGIGLGTHPINNPNFLITETGNLGIGEANPQAKLHVHADASSGFGTGMLLEYESQQGWGYGFLVALNSENTKALAVRNTDWEEDVFCVHTNGVLNAKKIYAEEVEVRLDALNMHWPDYVFEDDYQISSIEDIELFIENNKHLPGVPSEEEISEDGINLGEMNAILLEKIEELTLHVIEQNKRIKNLESQINQ